MVSTFLERAIAPPIPDLSPRAELALLARALHREGYDDHLAGHITLAEPDGTLLVNPFGLAWDEIRACDVMRIDREGNVLEGPWTVTPAIELHLAVHRLRRDIRVCVHNHPRWATIWADAHRVPPIYDQTSAMTDGDPVLVEEYRGAVADRANAEAVAEALGSGKCALLANHGVLVVAGSVRQAYLRAMTLEWRCRQAWHVEALGGGVPLDPAVARRLGTRVDETGFRGLWEAMVRRELRADPSVLE